MGKSINSWERREAEAVVRPALSGVGSGDFRARRRALEAGRAAMLAALPRLRHAMEASRSGAKKPPVLPLAAELDP